jgi:hypothetical protein
VLLVASYLTDQERRVEHEPEDQDEEEDDPKHKQDHLTQVENHPTAGQHDREYDETHPKRDEECD